MAETTISPGFTRNDGNEPVWDLQAAMKVTRMDNSLAMAQVIATYTNQKDGTIYEVASPIGGVALVIYIKDKQGKHRRQYGIELSQLVKDFFELEPALRAPEKPRSKKA